MMNYLNYAFGYESNSFDGILTRKIDMKRYIRDLSKGNQQKIGVASALMADPEILVLDEPFNSLDPSSQIRLKNMLNTLKKEKQVTMLISSHDLSHVTEVCDRIAILEKGLVVKDMKTSEGTLEELERYFAV
jgi:ABC-2 type transport system ATP-binding protein